MANFFQVGQILERRARLKSYRALRSELETLSETDLADIGMKRYQLGHVARLKTLK